MNNSTSICAECRMGGGAHKVSCSHAPITSHRIRPAFRGVQAGWEVTINGVVEWFALKADAEHALKTRGLLPSNEHTGATRYKLTTGHSDDAGLGGEGWVVSMSDHFPSFDTAQKWVKAEDYEALRQRFEKACGEVTRLRGELASIGEYDCPGGVHPKHCVGCAACDANKALSGDSSAPETQKPSNDETLVCDDCRQPTTWEHAVQADLWGRATGDVLCENCAESRWQRHQERLMETT